MLFSSKNVKYSTRFINKLVSFSSGKVKFNVAWNALKIHALLSLKDNVQHLSCVIYKSICSCEETYGGETIRKCKIRWNEHNDVNKNFKPAKHLAKNI